MINDSQIEEIVGKDEVMLSTSVTSEVAGDPEASLVEEEEENEKVAPPSDTRPEKPAAAAQPPVKGTKVISPTSINYLLCNLQKTKRSKSDKKEGKRTKQKVRSSQHKMYLIVINIDYY